MEWGTHREIHELFASYGFGESEVCNLDQSRGVARATSIIPAPIRRSGRFSAGRTIGTGNCNLHSGLRIRQRNYP